MDGWGPASLVPMGADRGWASGGGWRGRDTGVGWPALPPIGMGGNWGPHRAGCPPQCAS